MSILQFFDHSQLIFDNLNVNKPTKKMAGQVVGKFLLNSFVYL